MNIRRAGSVSDAMNDIAHADTLRPPAPSPWLDAPTHDGLWWVLTGDNGRAFLAHINSGRILGALDWRSTMGWNAYAPFPSHWKFAPAVPPATP